MQKTRITAWAVALLALTLPAFPQGNPTGTISGQVSDPQGLALPGLSVTASSPALQGTRSAVTSENGDYIIPFLPPGDYTLSFELSGFQTATRKIRVAAAQNPPPVDVKMTLSTMTETISVTAQAPGDFTQTSLVAASYKRDIVEKLPIGRTLNDAVRLAPGTTSNGPSDNITMSGAMSFENVFMVNGVAVQDNIRNTSLSLFIEDAIQETTTSTASISAEYGRFGGGVVNAVTKSGGNDFSGSFRTTFDNDSWRAGTPYPCPNATSQTTTQTLAATCATNDPRTSKVVPTYEATVGGPFIKDKLWFFGAGRFRNSSTTGQTSFTNLPFTIGDDEKRYEGKLTYSLNSNHTFKGSYSKITRDQTNNSFSTIMDQDSLYDRQLPQELFSANYTGVLRPNFFVEAQYSRRKFSFVNSGSRFTDLIKGTLMLDRSRGNARYNSPTFCGVCDPEKRDNSDVLVKASYFLSTKSAGSHSFVVGFDGFNDQRFSNNHQSGSDYRVYTTGAIFSGGDIFPVMDASTFIRWTPIFESSQGNNFRTYSGFLNDVWRLNSRLSFNVGARYDKNDGKDSIGRAVVKDSAFSPRLSMTFDPKGDGTWTINAGYAKYVAAIANSIGDSSSPGGQPATIDFDYLGPNVNTLAGAPLVSRADALKILFDWFNANGGTDRTTRGAPSIPGLTAKINESLASPNNIEFTAGVTRRLGSRGLVRVDGVYRKFRDFYSQRLDTGTGRVTDSTGKIFNLAVIENTNDLKRNYKGINFQANYRATDRLSIAGNYTLSWTKGNYFGETSGSGPITSGVASFPEYFDLAWNAPVGYLGLDQRHRVRGWATWDAPVPQFLGSLSLGVLQSVNSGTPYGGSGSVDTRPFITNPGYISPPASVTYFFTARDAFRTENEWRTDVSLNWSRKLGLRETQLFFRGTIQNVFNRQGLVDQNYLTTTVLTRSNNTRYAAFNPFTTQPVNGVNWDYAATFGTPTSRLAYQTPRTYQFSVGFRF